MLLLLVRMMSAEAAESRVDGKVTSTNAVEISAFGAWRSAFRFRRRHLWRTGRVGSHSVPTSASSALLRRLHHLLVLAPSVLEPNFHLVKKKKKKKSFYKNEFIYDMHIFPRKT